MAPAAPVGCRSRAISTGPSRERPPGARHACGYILALAVQIPHAPAPPSPPPATGDRGSTRVERVYGVPEPVDLWSLSHGKFHRHTVTTKGRMGQLDPRGRYFQISEENARVVLFGVPEIDRTLSQFVGKRVEVVGYARDLVAAQGTCLFRIQRVPQSICDDPDLPPTPDLTPDRSSWPQVSITAWSITDVTPLDAKDAEGEFATALDGSPGAKVRLRGRFGGANLEGVLASRAPEPDAWILRHDDGAVWVIGRPPRGKGWSLDRRYRGDLGRWLEVEGILARCGAETCVRARRVLLAAR